MNCTITNIFKHRFAFIPGCRDCTILFVSAPVVPASPCVPKSADMRTMQNCVITQDYFMHNLNYLVVLLCAGVQTTN